MLSLLVATGAWAAESRLQSFVAQLKGLDAAGKKAAMKALTDADRKAMHGEYKAMPAAEKKVVDAALGRGKAKAGGGAGRASKGVIGTVQYDTNTAHIFRDDFGAVVGNRFNTGFGNPHTISLVTFDMNGTFAFTPARVYGVPVGTAAPVLAATTFSGLGLGLTVWDVPDIAGHNGTFLVGISQSGTFSTIDSTFTGIDVDIVNGGQGFHGMNINLGGSAFNPAATVAPGNPYNAIMRATGNNLPVELMNFDVQ